MSDSRITITSVASRADVTRFIKQNIGGNVFIGLGVFVGASFGGWSGSTSLMLGVLLCALNTVVDATFAMTTLVVKQLVAHFRAR